MCTPGKIESGFGSRKSNARTHVLNYPLDTILQNLFGSLVPSHTAGTQYGDFVVDKDR